MAGIGFAVPGSLPENLNVQVDVRCRREHVFKRSIQHLRKSTVCPDCRRLDEAAERTEALRTILMAKGFTLAAPLTLKAQRVDIVCPAGHAINRKIHDIQIGKNWGCHYCDQEPRRRFVSDLAAARDLTVVDFDGRFMSRVKARCRVGHEVEVYFQGIEHGLWCTTCSGTFAEDKAARAIEAILGRPVLRNDRIRIAPLELDILDPVSNVAVEFCGLW